MTKPKGYHTLEARWKRTLVAKQKAAIANNKRKTIAKKRYRKVLARIKKTQARITKTRRRRVGLRGRWAATRLLRGRKSHITSKKQRDQIAIANSMVLPDDDF